MYSEMTLLCPKTIFQIRRVLPICFRRKKTVGGKEKECVGKRRLPFLDQREDLRYYAKWSLAVKNKCVMSPYFTLQSYLWEVHANAQYKCIYVGLGMWLIDNPLLRGNW